MSIWMLLLAIAVVLILIAWPYGTHSNPNDPAYFYSRTWRPEVLGIGLLFGLVACVSAYREDTWIAALLSIGTMVILTVCLVGSKRAQFFINKELRALERRRRNKSEGR